MAHSVDMHNFVHIGNLDVYKNCDECVQALARVTDPEVKFSALDLLTTKAFRHHSFTQLEGLGRSLWLSQYAEDSAKRYGLDPQMGDHSPKYAIAVAEKIVHNCMRLSKEVMESINPAEKNRSYSVCSEPDTYIANKAIHALEKFINASNFKSSAFEDHPMHSLYEKYWKLQDSKHLESCPCHKMISIALNTPDLTVSPTSIAPSTSTSSSVQSASSAPYAKNPHFKKCYFTAINWPLENGATLGICHPPYWEKQPLLFISNDNKVWDVELPIEEEFKYVIVKDGQVRYEKGSNRYRTSDGSLHSTEADDLPRF